MASERSSVPEEEWRADIKKWEFGIGDLIATATAEDLNSYCRAKTKEYNINNWLDEDLWESFRDDFKDFTREHFAKLTKVQTFELRKVLLCGGVYVPPSTVDTHADAFMQTLQEEQQHTWTLEDVSDAARKYSTAALRSRNLTTYYPALPKPPPTSPPAPVYAAPAPAPMRAAPTALPSSTASPPIFQTPVYNPLPRRTDDVREPPNRPALNPRANFQPRADNPPPRADFPDRERYTPQYTPQPYGNKEISDISKMITDEQKYSGSGELESLDHHLNIFYDICTRLDLPHNLYARAFPAMLKGLAQDHYYSHNLSRKRLTDTIEDLRLFFEGSGFHRRNLNTWNSLTLNQVVSTLENAGKSTQDCLRVLISTLTKLKFGLAPELRTDAFMHAKLVNACQGHPACKFATYDPPNDVGDLINKLMSSISAYEREQGPQQAFFTDRRFHKAPYDSSNRQGYRRGYSTRGGLPRRQARCFVCKKPGCWSWKHTGQEQRESKARFTAANKHKYPNAANFAEIMDQFIADFEGDESDSDDVGTAFESFVAAGRGEDEEHLSSLGDLVLTASESGSSSGPAPRSTAGKETAGRGGAPPQLGSAGDSYSFLSNETACSLVQELANRSFEHRLTAVLPEENHEEQSAYLANSRYDSSRFQGIMIDTGAAQRSTAGFDQFQALQRICDVQIDESTRGMVSIQFGIGSATSIGSTAVYTPVGTVEFHIVNASTPFLLSLADMDRLKIYLNNITNTLVTADGRSVPIVRRFGHPFLLWHAAESFVTESLNENPCFLTDIELRRLHRRFGHPSVGRLEAVLTRAGHDVSKKTLEYLTKYCEYCQKHGKSPGRFKFTLQDDVEFNYCVTVDVMYVNNMPLLHIVDQATRFQAGKWLQSISAKHTWDALRECWIDTYLGPPDLIAHDAGKNFVSKEFKLYAKAMGVLTKSVPVEAHNSIGLVERYHGPLRRIYKIISEQLPDLNKNAALQMSFKALNDSAGPDGLVPTLLVFGAFPRMAELDAPSPTVLQRTAALQKAMEEVKRLRAKRQVDDALNTRNGPKVDAIHGLSLNSPVLVWREGNGGKTGNWTGPFQLLSISGETCVVDLPSGQTSFRSTSVKPFYTTDEQTDAHKSDGETITVETPPPLPQPDLGRAQDTPPKRGRGRPRTHPLPDVAAFVQEHNQFQDSRSAEITGLLEKGVFQAVDRSEIPQGTRIFNSRFVDHVKNEGTSTAFEKSRLVVQAYNDLEKDTVLTQSPTIQRVSQRLVLCLAAIMRDTTQLYLRDISQAYVQSATKLNRDFYIVAPEELTSQLGLAKGSVVKVIKPLYGVPEAGNHWFKTYHSHHTNELYMKQSTYDPCLLYRLDTAFGVVGLQTDDTLLLADPQFAEAEQAMLQKAQFLAKERESLSTSTPLKFNGGLIQLKNDAITLTQERQSKNLHLVSVTPTSTTSSRGTVRKSLSPQEQYVAQRARGAYIASVCQPEASFDLSFAAQTTTPDEDDIKLLNKRLKWQIENPSRGLKFVPLQRDKLKLLVFTDASFANNKDLSSQIGALIALADDSNHANTLHWTSVKCKRVTRSVLASELYAMVLGFDIAGAIKATIDKILTINLPLVLCTDSKSLYDCLVKLGTTQEKRLMIDVLCLRQSYERREIAEVKWIAGDSNPADALTKGKGASNALKQLLDTNRIKLEAVEWVERESTAQ